MKLYLFIILLAINGYAYGHGNQSHSTLGNGNNINNCNPTLSCPKAKVVTKTVEKIVERVVERDAKLNAISLTAGGNPTQLKIEGNKASTNYEIVLGLLYQRDFSSVRGSVGVTIRGSAFLGVGVRF